MIHVEGQTEESVVNEILCDYLFAKGFHSVSARIIGDPRNRLRGGIQSWPLVKRDICRHLKEDGGCVATTMVDFYALPASGERAWPGRKAAFGNADSKGRAVESALLDDLSADMGSSFNRQRFIPFVVMHEFEGLLFSDCAALSKALSRPEIYDNLQAIRDQFATPEEINDSPDTAPSKRLQSLMIRYQKPLFGRSAMLEIGVDRVRWECPHFNDWLNRLESAV